MCRQALNGKCPITMVLKCASHGNQTADKISRKREFRGTGRGVREVNDVVLFFFSSAGHKN